MKRWGCTLLQQGKSSVTDIDLKLYVWLEHWSHGRDPTQSYDKSPHTHSQIQKETWQHKTAT